MSGGQREEHRTCNQIEPMENNTETLEGYLKQKGIFSTYKKYYFVLHCNERLLRKYKTDPSSSNAKKERKKLLETINMGDFNSVQIVSNLKFSGKENTISIIRKGYSPIVLKAETQSDYYLWKSRLEKCNRPSLLIDQSSIDTVTSYLSGTSLNNSSETVEVRVNNGLMSLVESIANATVISDSRGNIISFNNSAEQMFGWRKEEAIGQNVTILMPNSYAINHSSFMNTYFQTGYKKLIGKPRLLPAKHKDGTIFSVMISLGEWSELQSKSNSPSSSTSHNPDTYFISIFEYANNKAITNTQPNTFIEAKVKEQASAEITDTNSQANTNENMISKTYRNELQVPHKLSMLDISRQLLLINETEQLFQDIHTEISTSKNSEVTTGSIHDQYKEGTEQDSFPSNTAYDLSDSDSEEQLDWLNNEKLDITRKLHFLILEKRKRNHKRQQQPDEEYEEILFNQFKKLFEEAMENELKRTDKPMKIDVSKKFLDSNHKYCTLLHTAASSEALLIMNYLVEVCLMNVDVLDNMHSTPLFYACASNCPNACLFLLSKGAKPNIRDHFENFPLLVAIRNGNFNCADHLLLYGADINFTGRKGTCLHAMCQCGSLEKVNYLTSAGKEGNSTNLVSKNRHGQTPLFLALPYPEIVDLLLRKMRINAEKSPNSTELFFKWLKLQDENHRSVFHLCCELGYMKSLLLIVSYCSSDMLREVFAERDDIKKSTPLHLAITAKHYDLAKILVLSNEVDVNIRDQNGNTPLHLALDIEDLDHCKKFVDLLINMGNPNLQIKNNMKLTPIKLAKEKNIELTKNDDTNELKIDLKYLTETPFLKQNLNDATLNFTMDLNNYFSKIQASEMRRKQHSATNKNVEKLSKTYDLLDAYKIDEHLFPELLEFKEFVSFGIKFLDDQNQKLFDMTNSLYIICTKRYSDLDRKSTEYVISNLIEYAYTQFNNEIRLINYHFSNSNDTVRKELEQHENEHEEFKKSLEKYHERLKKSEDYFELQLLHMLTSFIKNHIIKKDKLLYASVIEKMIYNRDFL